MKYQLTTVPESKQYKGDSWEELLKHLELVKELPFFQVVVDKEDGQNFCLFCNRNHALAVWHDGQGGGADAYNPDYAGQEEAQQIYLDNGGWDDYPQSDCITKHEGVFALMEFCQSSGRPQSLHWHDI